VNRFRSQPPAQRASRHRQPGCIHGYDDAHRDQRIVNDRPACARLRHVALACIVLIGCVRTARKPDREGVDVRAFGAIGDGASHPLSRRFRSLQEARAEFPNAVSLEDEIDGLAIQRAIDSKARTLRFGAGTYLVSRSLVPQSHQSWSGEGSTRSVVSLPQRHVDGLRPLVDVNGPIVDFHVSDLGFRGNRPFQQRSNDNAAFWLRAGASNVDWSRCAFAAFGDQAGEGGGGIVVVPSPRAALQNLRVADSTFSNITNIPGIYVGQSSGQASATGIRIERNSFSGGGRQNCVYITSDDARSTLRNVQIVDNVFAIKESIDTAIELNGVEEFQISGNSIEVSGSAKATAILLRDGVRRGSVSRNIVRSSGTAQGLTAISLVRHDRPGSGTISEVELEGNEIVGFDGVAIQIGAGSRHITVSANTIGGAGRMVTQAMRIADAKHVRLSRNHVLRAAHVRLACGSSHDSGIEHLMIEDNEFVQVGAVGEDVIDTEGSACDATFISVIRNSFIDPIAGTRYVFAPRFRRATGNTFRANRNGSLAPLDPGLRSFVMDHD
jgi:hypothetical protein